MTTFTAKFSNATHTTNSRRAYTHAWRITRPEYQNGEDGPSGFASSAELAAKGAKAYISSLRNGTNWAVEIVEVA